MDNFIETMIKGHDYTPHRWVSGKCAETCIECKSNSLFVKPMNQWLSEGLPQSFGKGMYHTCGDSCECRLEKEGSSV